MLDHLGCVIIEHGIMLNDYERVIGLLQNGHELEDRKTSPDLQLREPAVQLAQYAGVVAGDIQHFKPLQIRIPIQGLDEHLPGRYKDIEGSLPEGKLEVHMDLSMPFEDMRQGAQGERNHASAFVLSRSIEERHSRQPDKV